jgi:flagellar hook-associated protein 2
LATNIDTTAVTSALGVGSGMDIKVIAQSLADAKVLPQKQRVEADIEEYNARVSGYSALNYGLSIVEGALNLLNDKNDFNVITSISSDSTAVTVEADSDATTGRHEIEVSRLAYAQRSASAGFSAGTATINSGNAFNVNMTVGGVTTTVQLNNSAQLTESSAFSSNSQSLNSGSALEVELTINGSKSTLSVNAGSDTPQGIIDAINGASLGVSASFDGSNKIQLVGSQGSSNAFTIDVTQPDTSGNDDGASLGLSFTNTQSASSGAAAASPNGVVYAINQQTSTTGISAELINTGIGSNPHRIVLSGKTGADNSFSVTVTNVSDNSSVSDLAFSTTLQSAQDSKFTVNGLEIERASNSVDDVVTGLTFSFTEVTSNPVTLDLTRDTTTIKDNITGLVNAYNEFVDVTNLVQDADSDDEEFGGTLINEQMVRQIKDKVYRTLVDTSSTPGDDIKALRDLGIEVDRYGKLQLDESDLDDALLNKFDQVVTMFTADTNNQTVFSTATKGLSGDVLTIMYDMTKVGGLIETQLDSTEDAIAEREDKLKELEQLMSEVYDRYIKQFSVMESAVTEMNSIRERIQQTFEYQSNSK